VERKAADRFEFETVPGQDARPQVAREIIAAGLDLLELQPLSLSLEEIFLQLTRDEADAAAPVTADTTTALAEEASTPEGESL
jgi:ABC-2 type transport system ATP-binding protein